MIISIEILKRLFPNYEGNSEVKEIDMLMYDSRNHTSNSLFVPIIGETHDAHQFIEQAIKNGAAASLWASSHPVPKHLLDQCQFFVVEDTIAALQQLARYYREHVNPIVIAVTGSNGKTTTKDLMSSVLSTSFRVHKTEGNFNNHIGMPMTILNMPEDTEILVLEMGMSNFGEIELLSDIAKPNYAVITNIGESHIEYLGTREGIARAKLEIIHGIDKENGILFIDGDEPLLQEIDENINVVRCSFHNKQDDYVIDQVTISGNETSFHVNHMPYKISLLGAHHAKNATFAIMIGERLGLKHHTIQQGFAQMEHTQMRFEILTGKNGVTLINDAYNASPTSMKAAINVLKQMEQYKRKVVVLGDILELGNRSLTLHQEVAEAIDQPINVVFTYGKASSTITDFLKENRRQIKSEHFTAYDDVVTALEQYLTADTAILFKASRGMALEKIIEKVCS